MLQINYLPVTFPGSKADLFTGVLPNMYQPPAGFWFDVGRIYYDQNQVMIMVSNKDAHPYSCI